MQITSGAAKRSSEQIFGLYLKKTFLKFCRRRKFLSIRQKNRAPKHFFEFYLFESEKNN